MNWPDIELSVSDTHCYERICRRRGVTYAGELELLRNGHQAGQNGAGQGMERGTASLGASHSRDVLSHLTLCRCLVSIAPSHTCSTSGGLRLTILIVRHLANVPSLQASLDDDAFVRA